MRPAMSLAVVGVAFDNKRGPTRRFEIAICLPGEPVELRAEPKNPADSRAIGVYSMRGVQIGYIQAEKAQWIGTTLGSITAIFQRAESFGAVIRVTFDGSAPALPPEPLPRAACGSTGGGGDDWPPPHPIDEFSDPFH